MKTVEAKCDLCEKPIDRFDISFLGKWTLHSECYNIAVKRLEPFIKVLFGPKDEWQEWLEATE